MGDEFGRPATVMTVKAGGGLGGWHVVHIVLSVATGGLWLIAYAVHTIVASVNRPTITLEVPDGARIEYRNGYPNVLMPDEYLEPEPRRELTRSLMIGATIGLIIAMAGLGMWAALTR